MCPGKHLITGAVAGDVPVGIEAFGLHRVEPDVEREPLAPLLEGTAGAPDPLDDAPDATVAPRRDALGKRRRRIVPLQLRPSALQRVAEQCDLALQLIHA